MTQNKCTEVPTEDWSEYSVEGLHDLEESHRTRRDGDDLTVILVEEECQNCGAEFERIICREAAGDESEFHNRIVKVGFESGMKKLIEHFDQLAAIDVTESQSPVSSRVHVRVSAAEAALDEGVTNGPIDGLSDMEQLRLVIEDESSRYLVNPRIDDSPYGPQFETELVTPVYRAGEGEQSISLEDGLARLVHKLGLSTEEARELVGNEQQTESVQSPSS